jgi:hypothetical protein
VNRGTSIKIPITAWSEVLRSSVAGPEETTRLGETDLLTFPNRVGSTSGQIGVATRQFVLVSIASWVIHRTNDHETAVNDDLARQAGIIASNTKENGPRTRRSKYIV